MSSEWYKSRTTSEYRDEIAVVQRFISSQNYDYNATEKQYRRYREFPRIGDNPIVHNEVLAPEDKGALHTYEAIWQLRNAFVKANCTENFEEHEVSKLFFSDYLGTPDWEKPIFLMNHQELNREIEKGRYSLSEKALLGLRTHEQTRLLRDYKSFWLRDDRLLWREQYDKQMKKQIAVGYSIKRVSTARRFEHDISQCSALGNTCPRHSRAIICYERNPWDTFSLREWYSWRMIYRMVRGLIINLRQVKYLIPHLLWKIKKLEEAEIVVVRRLKVVDGILYGFDLPNRVNNQAFSCFEQEYDRVRIWHRRFKGLYLDALDNMRHTGIITEPDMGKFTSRLDNRSEKDMLDQARQLEWVEASIAKYSDEQIMKAMINLLNIDLALHGRLSSLSIKIMLMGVMQLYPLTRLQKRGLILSARRYAAFFNRRLLRECPYKIRCRAILESPSLFVLCPITHCKYAYEPRFYFFEELKQFSLRWVILSQLLLDIFPICNKSVPMIIKKYIAFDIRVQSKYNSWPLL